jgi:hypothetical protein
MSWPAQDLPYELDVETADLLMALQFTSGDDVAHWFELVGRVYEERPDADVADFGARLTSEADANDSDTVENFVQVLVRAGDGLAPVARLLAVQQELPDLYRELGSRRSAAELHSDYYANQQYAQGGEPAGRFDWVPEPQRGELIAAWGEDWEDRLAEQLDARWPTAWQSFADDYKRTWFSATIPELIPPPPPTED